MTVFKTWDAAERYLVPFLWVCGSVLFAVGVLLSQDLMLAALLIFGIALIQAQPADEKLEAVENTGFKYLFATVAVTAGLILAVMLLNFLVNPYGIFDHRLTSQIPPAGRDKKIELYAAYDLRPQVVILGSSRSFGILPATVESLTGKLTFNASVENGLPRDYLAFANYMSEQGQFPEVLVVGLAVDQVAASSTGGAAEDSADDALSPYLDGYVEPTRLQALKSTLRNVFQLVSYHQTQSSIDLLAAQVKNTLIPHHAFASDGAGQFYVNPLPEMIKSDIEGEHGDKFETLDRLDPDQLAYLEAFLQVAHEHGTRVIIYLPTYHPQLLALYQEQNFPQLKAALLDQLEQWQAEYDLSVYDFTDVTSFGGTDLMFYDTIHATEEANNLMVDWLAPAIARPVSMDKTP